VRFRKRHSSTPDQAKERCKTAYGHEVASVFSLVLAIELQDIVPALVCRCPNNSKALPLWQRAFNQKVAKTAERMMPLGVSTREMTEHGTRLANISLNPYPIWRAQGRSATIGFWLLWFGHIPILQVAQPCSGKRLRKAN
jgi:hypothetical protein